ncbi:MAG: hypothetical protein M3499_03340 [Actinomycetota bacterium]|nr:hypothetical protein [Actinomycetota bacterium]
MYPDDATLMELGRIAVAAGRLDAALGAVWWLSRASRNCPGAVMKPAR